MIDYNNIEDYIIDYLSDELTENEVHELLAFIAEHPEYQAMIDDYHESMLDESFVEDIQYNPQHLLKEEIPQPINKGKNTWKYFGVIAAVVGLGVAGALMFGPQVAEESHKSEITPTSANTHRDAQVVHTENSIDVDTTQKVVVSSLTSHSGKVDVQGMSRMTQQHGVNHPDSVMHQEEKKITTIDINTLDIQQLKPKLSSSGLIIHTSYIPEYRIPEVMTAQDNNDMILSIGGKDLELNLEPIKEIKEKIEDVKNTIHQKVEEAPVPTLDIWEVIKK